MDVLFAEASLAASTSPEHGVQSCFLWCVRRRQRHTGGPLQASRVANMPGSPAPIAASRRQLLRHVLPICSLKKFQAAGYLNWTSFAALWTLLVTYRNVMQKCVILETFITLKMMYVKLI